MSNQNFDLKKFTDHLARDFDINFDEPPAKSNENQILPAPAANSNESPDLQTAPRKSGHNKNLGIWPPPPDISAAHRAHRCSHAKSNGVRCGSPALSDGIYCYFHEIWRAQPECQPHRPDPNGLLFKLPLLEDANGVQMALQQVLDSVLANKMDLRGANTLLYGLQTAAANAKHTRFDPAGFRNEIVDQLL